MRESMGSFHKHAYLYISFLEQDSLNSWRKRCQMRFSGAWQALNYHGDITLGVWGSWASMLCLARGLHFFGKRGWTHKTLCPWCLLLEFWSTYPLYECWVRGAVLWESLGRRFWKTTHASCRKIPKEFPRWVGDTFVWFLYWTPFNKRWLRHPEKLASPITETRFPLFCCTLYNIYIYKKNMYINIHVNSATFPSAYVKNGFPRLW